MAENLIYGAIAVFLVGSAFVLLGVAAKTSLGLFSDFSQQPVLEVLDILLLVFIVVELLFAVRTTVEKRELVAEPFLLVGIIASIKEIVVLSVEAASALGKGEEFDDRVVEIGLLGVLVVLLGRDLVPAPPQGAGARRGRPGARQGSRAGGGAGAVRLASRTPVVARAGPEVAGERDRGAPGHRQHSRCCRSPSRSAGRGASR